MPFGGRGLGGDIATFNNQRNKKMGHQCLSAGGGWAGAKSQVLCAQGAAAWIGREPVLRVGLSVGNVHKEPGNSGVAFFNEWVVA